MDPNRNGWPWSRLVFPLAVVGISSACLWAAERTAPGARSAETGAASASNATPREREGTTLVDVPGYFKLTSDRGTFHVLGSQQRYLGLENLNLERIGAIVSENPDQLEWIVSGTLTEYRGTNYLLITKATLKNKARASARGELRGADR